MKKEKISALQLFYVLGGFECGSAIVLGLGSGAKQDAWIVIILAMFCGLILMGVYTQLSVFYPEDSLIQMLPKIIGKYLSYPVIIIYICYFTYIAARNCRDFSELLASSILDEMPIAIVIGSFMILMVYCLRGGIETFGRMGEIVFPIYIFSVIIIWVLLITVERFTINNLTPILGNGFKPVVKEVFPSVLTFPFGESIIITMLLPYVNKKQHIKKVALSVILFSGLLLVINSIMMLSVLGPEIYTESFFPLLESAQMVSIADFLERFDALVILMMVAGVFFKVGCWTFGAAVGISQLFKLKQTHSVLLGICTIISALSLLIGDNFVEFLESGIKYIPIYVHVPLQIIVPILLLCIAFIRKKISYS
ncbi:GerAB/ArcD/ProY family transporter [Metabacillus bambusae]|uniref:Endospore germination permease n=1 Tax=Metabacillus bambusae TaxID=2795218 RepID=A0ABS3N6H1_9BACI|nr:endospore germination permease [Metabacillus bambusae]MBO1513671.1 endospore germination permease [Metabacillus bambusae]